MENNVDWVLRGFLTLDQTFVAVGNSTFLFNLVACGTASCFLALFLGCAAMTRTLLHRSESIL